MNVYAISVKALVKKTITLNVKKEDVYLVVVGRYVHLTDRHIRI